MLPDGQTSSREEHALRQLRRAVALDPADVKALLALGDYHLKHRELDKSLSAYERVAHLYHRDGTLIKAVAVYKQMHSLIATYAPTLAARFAHTRLQLAEALEQLGLIDDAGAQWKDMARRRWKARDVDGAASALTEALRIAPHDLMARSMTGELHNLTGDTAAAIIAFEQVVTMAIASGLRDDALGALEKLAGLRDRVGDVRLAAEILLERDAPEDAQAALRKLQICFRSDRRDLKTLRLLVRAFDQCGQPHKGDQVLKEAARVARDMGMRDTFAKIIDALRTRAPDDPSVEALLAEL